MKLTFLGANRQVTGSRYLLEAGGLRMLVDCGLVQERPYLDRNWSAPPFDPASIDLLLLTHAHLDHSGLLPRLAAQGFAKPIYATPASVDLARLVLTDSARIQEEDAAFKKIRHEKQGHPPAGHGYQPLYTVQDANQALALFKAAPYDQMLKLNDRVQVIFRDAGHILGSSILDISVKEDGRIRHVVFSGDLGTWNKPLIKDPAILTQADALVLESTYGDRDHDTRVSVEDQLEQVINQTVRQGGNLVVPTFAIERAQELLFHLSRLVRADRIPHLMVFLDSPMAASATDLFQRHREVLDKQAAVMLDQDRSPFEFPGLVLSRSIAQSKAINRLRGSCIILAGAGMCTGGRIKHHLAQNIGNPQSTILFVGYQSQGTLGREIVEGVNPVRIFGQMHTVKAQVAQIQGMSAHADRATLLRWLGAFKQQPGQIFLTHGEVSAAEHLAQSIAGEFRLQATVPAYGDQVELA